MLGLSMPINSCASVLFPQPDSPTMPSVSPRRICRSSPLRACTCSVTRPSQFLRAGKLTCTLSSSSKMSDMVFLPLRVPAGSHLALCTIRKQARCLTAFRPGGKAALAERAALWKLVEIRHRAGNGRKQLARRTVFRCTLQQADGVGMNGMVDQRLRGTALNYASRVHHIHPVTELGNHGHIVADKQHRGSAGPRLVLQQTQDLQLHGHIQRRGRLVGDDKFRLAGEGKGDHHSLTHAAGQFKRITRHHRFRVRDLHLLQQGNRFLLRRATVERLMLADHLHHLLANPSRWVQGGHGLLKNHRHFCPAPLA
ncbi:hypothetical protein EcWSU1_02297 [Enterobacter ludwigii]|uniref:Uncharacterized protein n=1 Tax=Enterobacter ludwigii TaxID=299767 RepID=G8LC99_9ENTR|nr:hypothetical protein EcWSU1_02297 [Enterobacter ludwigii]